MTGQTISHFTVLDRLGGGGMGVVYVAEDLHLDRRVALKFLPPHLSTDEEAKQRFIQEAKAASALNHPNVCTIYDIDESKDAQLFIAMALYEGETLREKLESGPLPTEEAADIARQVAEGLAAAHEQGIIHRDIKPANILVTKRGRAVILDFGLAKLTGSLDLTKSGSTLGTAHYMSPEQIRNEEVDHRTDMWSLGVVLYEMLAGERPFTGEYDQAISYAILNQEPPALPNQPASIEGIVSKTLRKDAAERTKSAATLAETLKAAIAQSPASDLMGVTAEDATAARRARLKKPLILVGIAGIVAVMIATVLLWPTSSGTIPEESSIRLVVLPFETLGPSDYDYWGLGIAEDIATRLTTIGTLQVVATRSAAALLEERKSLAEIGEILGVDYLLEGIVQIDASQVRLSPKLVRTSDDVQVWAEPYDGDSKAALAFQAQVAKAVTKALGIVLDLGEKEALHAKLTDNEAAYRAYLQGTAATLNNKLDYFREAVALDSLFVRAHMKLARYYAYTVFSGRQDQVTLDSLVFLAAKAASRVEALAPGSVEASIAAGYVEYYARRDYASANEHFEDALERNASDLDVVEAIGYIRSRLGNQDGAVAALETAVALDPTQAGLAAMIAWLNFGLGRYDQADVWIDKAIAISPLKAELYYDKALLSLDSGDAIGARSILMSAPRFENKSAVVNAWLYVYWLEKDFDAIMDETDAYGSDSLDVQMGSMLALWRGLAAHLIEDKSEAAAAWGRLLELQRKIVASDFRLFGYAGLGYEDSLESAAADVLQEWQEDKQTLPSVLGRAAAALAMGGLDDQALDRLEDLANLQYRGGWSHHASLENVVFDPLRDDPRFQALVENWERKE